jgi:fatty acid desaturase
MVPGRHRRQLEACAQLPPPPLHQHVIGQDTDYGFGVFRFSEEVEWKPIHLVQPVLVPLSGLFFEYAIALYDLQLTQFLLPKKWRQENAMPLLSGPELRRELREFLIKSGKLELKEDVLLPLLAGLLAPKVLAGNVSARAIRNVWAFAVIYCGHLPDGNYTFTPQEAEAETRGQWYMRQILGSSNFEGGLLTHILSGHLSLQIEHHLFPDLPAWRYREIAPQSARDLPGVQYPLQNRQSDRPTENRGASHLAICLTAG